MGQGLLHPNFQGLNCTHARQFDIVLPYSRFGRFNRNRYYKKLVICRPYPCFTGLPLVVVIQMAAVVASPVGCVVSTYSTLDLGYDEGNVCNESILYSARPQAVVLALRSTCTHQLKSSARRSMDTFGFGLGHYLRGRMAVIPEQA